MLSRKFGILASLAVSLTTALAFAAPGVPIPPRLDRTTRISPAKNVYPDASLAKTQVEEAFMTAARSHRKVLIEFGGNWCPDCQILAGIFKQPEVAQWLESQFIVVPVNIGHIDENLEIAKNFGVTIREVPTVLVVTAGGTLLNSDQTSALSTARSLSPQAVLTLLNQWNQHN